MQAKTIDVRGKSCPQPVIETRRALLEGGISALRVIVDNEAATENVSRLVHSLGHSVAIDRRAEDEIHIQVAVADVAAPAAEAPADPPSQNVILIESRTIGDGDDELGAILMKAFLKTLKEVAPRPGALLFLNAGVHLTTEGSPYLADLRELAGMGVTLLSCGTCLDYYHLQDQLAVGKVTNMFEIVSRLTAADRILRP